MTRTELISYISEIYDAEAERPWAKYPDNVVFRHRDNKKWFALIMPVSYSKLGIPRSDITDIVNLKCEPLLIDSFVAEKGIFPAYHMNKAHWISVALDGSAEEDKIKMLLDMSYEQTKTKSGKKQSKKR